MKNLLLIFVMSVVLTKDIMAQKDGPINVPQQVSQAFANRFPAGKLRKWEERKDEYIASFTQDGNRSTAYYSPNGDWIKTETFIRGKRNLPDEIRQGFRKCSYSNWIVDKIWETESHSGPAVTMDVRRIYNYTEGQWEVSRLHFSMNGKLTEEEKLPITR
ncbi:MAG: hypothetical protein P4L51_05225 [Puia sp.]|nr:hypothetical protein [Puia sp.]